MDKQNIKLAIREKREEGVIVAYVSDMEEKEMLPIAAFSLGVAKKDKAVFEAWVKGMQGVMTAIVKSALGIEPSGYFRFNMGDKQ